MKSMLIKAKALLKQNKSKKEGFTLIELLVVVAIIVALAGAAIPIISNVVTAAENSNAVALERTLNDTFRYWSSTRSSVAIGAGTEDAMTAAILDAWGVSTTVATTGVVVDETVSDVANGVIGGDSFAIVVEGGDLIDTTPSLATDGTLVNDKFLITFDPALGNSPFSVLVN
jgi:prepilin-type N-terminal cleavage/methylation domain-containing protein